MLAPGGRQILDCETDTGGKCLESWGFLLFDWLINCFEIAFCAYAIELVFYSCSYWREAILQFKSVNVRPRSTPKIFALESQH